MARKGGGRGSGGEGIPHEEPSEKPLRGTPSPKSQETLLFIQEAPDPQPRHSGGLGRKPQTIVARARGASVLYVPSAHAHTDTAPLATPLSEDYQVV